MGKRKSSRLFGRGKQGRCDNCDRLAPDDEAFSWDDKDPDKTIVPFSEVDDPERIRVCLACAKLAIRYDAKKSKTT